MFKVSDEIVPVNLSTDYPACSHDPSFMHSPIWALYYAYREGPMLAEALAVIVDKAAYEAERPVNLDLPLWDRQCAERRASAYRQVRWSAIAMMDFLNGEEGFDSARDELEAALEDLR